MRRLALVVVLMSCALPGSARAQAVDVAPRGPNGDALVQRCKDAALSGNPGEPYFRAAGVPANFAGYAAIFEHTRPAANEAEVKLLPPAASMSTLPIVACAFNKLSDPPRVAILEPLTLRGN